MRIDLKTARILTSDEARETLLLFRHASDDPLGIQESFRGMFPKKIALALGELRQLRRRAEQKFSLGLDMFFTKEQLEQSSSERVAQWRAARFAAKGFQEVWDPCCGIGSDTIALALAGLRVHASDKDPAAVHFAEANAGVYGAEGIDFREANCCEEPPGEGALYLDPSRRRGSRRIMSPDDWSPPPSVVAKLLEGRPGACLKLSPAVSLELLLEKFPEPGEIEVISLNGEGKETIFWYGVLAGETPRRATILPAGTSFAGAEERAAPVGEIGTFLYDPDPSLVVSGLLGRFAQEHSLRVLDPEIAYLTSDQMVDSPFLDAFRVLAMDRLDARRMRAIMRERGVGRLEVRKRGISDRPLSLEQRFLPKAYGERHLTLLATRIGEGHVGILGERVD